MSRVLGDDVGVPLQEAFSTARVCKEHSGERNIEDSGRILCASYEMELERSHRSERAVRSLDGVGGGREAELEAKFEWKL
jgi:hypothetical protein